MDEQEKLPERADAQPRESSGEFLLRVLKPAGAVIVLLVLILSLIFCFTYRSPAPAETPQQETAQTAEN